METDISLDFARATCCAPDFDPYGKDRMYGTYGEDSVYRGQIAAIKSIYQLERLVEEGFSRLYMVASNGTVPIRRA